MLEVSRNKAQGVSLCKGVPILGGGAALGAPVPAAQGHLDATGTSCRTLAQAEKCVQFSPASGARLPAVGSRLGELGKGTSGPQSLHLQNGNYNQVFFRASCKGSLREPVYLVGSTTCRLLPGDFEPGPTGSPGPRGAGSHVSGVMASEPGGASKSWGRFSPALGGAVG